MIDLLNTAKKLLPKLNKFDKEYQRLIDFTNKYESEIQEIEEIDILSSENTTDSPKGGKSAESIRKKGRIYKKDYEKLRNLKAERMDELSKIKEEVDNLKGMIDQLKNSITKMKDNKPKQLDKMLEWKKDAKEFHKEIETFSSSSMIKDVEYIKTKLNSIKGIYQETANETIKNKVVPDFRLLDDNASSALEIIKKIKTDMERIKQNYFARASASELNADLKHLIAAANHSTSLLLNIKMFLQQYRTKNGWESFFVQSGGAAIKNKYSKLMRLVIEFSDKKNKKNKESYYQKYQRITSDNVELNKLGNQFINDFCKKHNINIEFEDFFKMYKNEENSITNIIFNVGYYKFKNNHIYKNDRTNDEIDLKNSPKWNGNGDEAFLIPLNVQNYYVFYPGKKYVVENLKEKLLEGRHLNKLFIVYKFGSDKKVFFLEPKTGLPILYYKKDYKKCTDDNILISLINPTLGSNPFNSKDIPAMKLTFDTFLKKNNNKDNQNPPNSVPPFQNECSGNHMLVKRFFDMHTSSIDITRSHSEIVDIIDQHKEKGKVDSDNYINAYNDLKKDVDLVSDYINTINFRIVKMTANITESIALDNSDISADNNDNNDDTLPDKLNPDINLSSSPSNNMNQKLDALKNKQKEEIYSILQSYLSDSRIKAIQDHEKDIITTIEKYMDNYSIKGKANNPSAKLLKISDYIKRLQELEVGFIKFSADKPIEQGLQGWNLKTTMSADKINTDKSIVLSLKDDISSLYVDKIKNKINAYQAANPAQYTMDLLKNKDAKYIIAANPDIISYLNKPGVVKEIIKVEPGIDKHDILGNIAQIWV